MTELSLPATSDLLDCQTWILKVYIHCEGCKKKVFKVLQSIDGVYKTVIDAQQHKATVTGSVDGDTLVQKLLKAGKHAQILPETTAAANGNSKKKKKKKQNNELDKTTGHDDSSAQVEDEKEKSDVTKREQDEISEPAVTGGDGGGKKKKDKNKKGDNNPPPNAIPVAGTENVSPQMVYDVPAYQNYYPTPAYGMSYSTFYPSAESSYYTQPVYGYTQSHPSIYYQAPPPPSYYRRSAFDDHDDENESGRLCTIM